MPLPSTFVDNTSDPIPQADYGIKISKAGFDALTAADNDLLFNSSWPSAQIVLVRPIAAGETSIVVPHGLGFPPVAFVMGGTDFRNGMYGCDVDDTNVYVSGGFSSACTLVVYRIDISVDIEYPYTDRPSTSVPYDPNYGIKMVKPGGDINSTELRDYFIHSRCGSPLVLAVKTQATSSPSNPTVVQYTSRLGYATLNLGYAGIVAGNTFALGVTYGNNAYLFAPQGGQSYPVAFTDGFTVYVNASTVNSFFNGKASVVCLRSPMFATTNTVAVTY